MLSFHSSVGQENAMHRSNLPVWKVASTVKTPSIVFARDSEKAISYSAAVDPRGRHRQIGRHERGRAVMCLILLDIDHEPGIAIGKIPSRGPCIAVVVLRQS
jgi:hypothetical protein